ncbi:MAG: hypothetical protein IPJ48_00090 [Propionivibrio sp.]|uniref:Uncharacterized protein n=1 Tax=Candidatus Propionivibrio dominans TaxID=2954373 RepID=A0A9D7FAT6_9RHOO|nr:hypothetical protein [Candidatus Propionivibrio dominans]
MSLSGFSPAAFRAGPAETSAGQEQAGSDASDADLAILAYQLQNSEPLSLAEEDESIVFDSENEALAGFLSRVEAQLNY